MPSNTERKAKVTIKPRLVASYDSQPGNALVSILGETLTCLITYLTGSETE